MAYQGLFLGGCRAAVAAASVFAGTAVTAQSVPGSLPTREQIELPRSDAPTPGAKVSVRDQAPIVEPCPFANSNLSADLRRVRFVAVDGRVLPASVSQILSAVRPTPGNQPIASLCALRDTAAERLRGAGYIASVQIPPQEITSGEVELRVIMARIVDIQVQGSPGPYGDTLNARIAKLKKLDPLNRYDAERILLLAGDVPGLDVALSLRPAGTQPGEVIGDLAIRYVPWTIVANGQNHGSRFVGRETGTLRAEAYGLTGLSDRTFLGVSSTADFEEQLVVQGGHYVGDHSGRSVGVRASYAWSRPDIGALDLRSRSLVAGLDFNIPMVRSLNRNLGVGGGLELINQRVRLHGGGGSLPLTEDRVRIAFARLAGSLREPAPDGKERLGLSGAIELRQGLDLFDATDRGEPSSNGALPSRADGNPTATVIRGGLDAFVTSGPFSLVTTAQGQWANDPLLSIEEFSVGNLTLGRGYDPGVTAGDRAVGIRIEPRLLLPRTDRLGVQLFAFHDRVRIWNLDEFATEDGRTLRSWGAGARFALPGRLLLETMYARPQDRGLSTDAKRASDRVLLSLTAQFPGGGR